jgi:hypothetical protein
MSLTVPTISVTVGGDTIATAEILSLTLHLGCTTEVSSFEMVMDNGNPDYNIGDYYPGGSKEFTLGDAFVVKLKRGSITGSTNPLLTGNVEVIDVLDEAEEFNYRNVVILRGRCKGLQLFARKFNGDLIDQVGTGYKAFKRTAGEAESLIAFLIDNYTSLSHTRVNSAITAQAASAQKDVSVTDGTKFTAGDLVKIRDGTTWEYNKVASIATNVLTMTSNLVNTYENTGYVDLDLIKDTNTSYTEMLFSHETIFDIIKFIADTASTSGGVIGYDSRVEYDGCFAFVSKGSIAEPYNLTGECQIERYMESIEAVKNKITVYGKAEASRPANLDDWTEGLETVTMTDADIDSSLSATYVLVSTNTYYQAERMLGLKQVKITAMVDFFVTDAGYYKITYQIGSGAETTIVTDQLVSWLEYHTFTHDVSPAVWTDLGETLTVRYYIRTDGPTIYAKDYKAIWDTIETAFWGCTGTGVSMGVSQATKYAGDASIDLIMPSTTYGSLYINFFEFLGEYLSLSRLQNVRFFVLIEDVVNVLGTIRVTLTDSNDVDAYQDVSITKGSWSEVNLATDYKSRGDWTVGAGFKWESIKKTDVKTSASAAASWYMCVDEFHLAYERWGGGTDNAAVDGFAEDVADSQAKYGVKEHVVINDMLLSNEECEAKAQSLLAFMKDKRITLEVETESLDWGDYAFTPGNKTTLVTGKMGLSDAYRIDSIDVRIDSKENKPQFTFILENTPLRMADYLHGLAKKVRELERDYAGIR